MTQSGSASRRRIDSPVLITCAIGLLTKTSRSKRSKPPSVTTVPVSVCQMKRRPTICGCNVRTNTTVRHSGTPATTKRSHSSVSTSCASGAERAPSMSQRTIGATEGGGGLTASPQVQILEEVVAFVVDDDKGREIDHFDAPDRFHTELGIFDAFDFLDAMFGQVRRGAPDGGEIEAAALFASLAHRRRAIAFGQRYHGTAGGLEIVDEGIHAPGGGRPERAGGIAGRRLR